MKSKAILIAVIVVLVAVFGFLLFRPTTPDGTVDVDAAGVQKAIDDGAQVIDVRTSGEYQMGHIPGAVNVPYDEIATQAASWDRDATYVVYCATGARSLTAVQTMESMGFTSIRHFAQGIQAWNGDLETGGSTSNATIETSGTPVMVEFYTEACPSCLAMKPIVKELQEEYGDSIEFRLYNVESDQAGVQLANSLGVEYVPTFLFVNGNGVISKQVVGEQTKDQMTELLDALQ